MDGQTPGKSVNKKQFYFLTADASRASMTGSLADVGISTTELTNWINPAIMKAQKRILIFDACQSGQAINDIGKMEGGVQSSFAVRNDNDDKAQQVKAIDKLNEPARSTRSSRRWSNRSLRKLSATTRR